MRIINHILWMTLEDYLKIILEYGPIPKNFLYLTLVPGGGGALRIFRVRGRAIGKGIYLPDIGIKNGINFHNFGIRNGTHFQDFYMKCIMSDILSRKIGIRSGILFKKLV